MPVAAISLLPVLLKTDLTIKKFLVTLFLSHSLSLAPFSTSVLVQLGQPAVAT